MLKPLRKLFRSGPAPTPPRVPRGERIYVIGDIHGRLDLLTALAEAIEADDRKADIARSTVILLGDLIDRGPHSAGVVAFALDWQEARPLRILCGNHEEMLLASLERVEVLRHFLRYGGRETILSYGLAEEDYRRATLEEVRQAMLETIPQTHIDFIRTFEDRIIIGDYLFVHAGILPEVVPDKQRTEDLRWIREPFLSFEGQHPQVVVHGHTIAPCVVERPNRIGIDTGAYMYGRLTALVLEGQRRRLLTAVDDHGTISVERGTTS